MRSIRFFAALLAVSVILAPAAWAQQTEVGTTAAVNTNTKGTPPRLATRNLFIGTNVFFEERIETSKTGQAQLLFLDESALTIGSNSDVVIDKFIYDPKTSKGEMALSVGAGLFRFVGGRISKTAGVRIKTPTATLGIRGGITIIEVDPGTGATSATFVFGKEMTVTNKSGVTRKVTRPGFSVDVASKDEEPSSPVKVSGAKMAGYLGALEGSPGQTAGLTEPLTDVQVAASDIDQLGSSNEPEDIAGVTAATGTTSGTTDPAPGDPATSDPTAVDSDVDIVEASQDEATETGVTPPPAAEPPPPPAVNAPTAIDLDNFTVPEDLLAPNGVIGVLSATEADGDPVTFSITDDPDGKFQIVGDELQLAAALDFEAMTSHSVTVLVTDKDGSFDKTFTITVTNVIDATTRTLNGYSGGILGQSDGIAGEVSISIFVNAFGDPASITIDTIAVSGDVGDVTATFIVGTPDGLAVPRLIAEFSSGGTFIDDTDFSASGDTALFEGIPAVDVFGISLETSAAFGTAGIFLPPGVALCECEFLQWGFWNAFVILPPGFPDGEVVTVSLANWVAGEIPALLDMPVSGTATYSGHAIGRVVLVSGNTAALVVGGFTQTYDFATGSGTFEVTKFDGVDLYSGGVSAIAGQENRFTGTGTGAAGSIDRTLKLNGAFFAGGGDPVAQVGGGFNITDPSSIYEASGIFAADRLP